MSSHGLPDFLAVPFKRQNAADYRGLEQHRIIDHFGLFGAIIRQMNLVRASGIGLMVLGLLLIQRA
jgi:hypothetical protein